MPRIAAVFSLMRSGWKNIDPKVRIALMAIFTAVVVSFICTLSHKDVLYYLKRTNANPLSNVKPGALYAIDDNRVHGSYLCEFEVREGDVEETGPQSLEFYNQVGKLLPMLASLGGFEVANNAFTRTWYYKELTFTNDRRPIKSACESFVKQAMESGKKVCPINAVMLRPKDGTIYAVKFHDQCLTPNCADCSSVDRPSHLIDAHWTTRLKGLLGVITHKLT